MKNYQGYRVLLWGVAAYHAVTGLLLLYSGELSIKALKLFAGMTVSGSPELGIAGEVLACYLLAFGLTMGIAAWDPVRNRAIITVGLVLFALRLFQRVYFSAKVMRVMQVTPARYWGAAVIVAVIAVLMGLFRWKVQADLGRAGE